MGIIDQTVYTLECGNCGTQETAKILDKGSSWGGSHWQSGTDFYNFNSTWEGGVDREPKLIEISCKKCEISDGVTVKIT